MKKSLSTRLMYSFMTIIIIVVVGITAGIYYLIADYFLQIKEQELAEKEMRWGKLLKPSSACRTGICFIVIF